jgi:hypothetical protein
MVFVVLERAIVKKSKTIYKGKDWQKTHYTNKTEQENAHKTEWNTDVGDLRSSFI